MVSDTCEHRITNQIIIGGYWIEMKENQILVCIKEPGKEPRVEPLFDNTLEAFQKAVGGYIETVTVAEDLVLVCNEEGRLHQMPFNEIICGVPFVGPVIAAAVKGDEFVSIKGKSVSMVLRMLAGDRGE